MKWGKTYETSFTYEELIKNKILRIYDDVNEIYQLLYEKILNKNYKIIFLGDEINIIFEFFVEKTKYDISLKLNKKNNGDINKIVEDLIKCNNQLEDRVYRLEKIVEELATNKKNNTSCWRCGDSIDIKLSNNDEIRRDKFVYNGNWGICKKCENK
jgi:hypothetical protein